MKKTCGRILGTAGAFHPEERQQRDCFLDEWARVQSGGEEFVVVGNVVDESGDAESADGSHFRRNAVLPRGEPVGVEIRIRD